MATEPEVTMQVAAIAPSTSGMSMSTMTPAESTPAADGAGGAAGVLDASQATGRSSGGQWSQG